MTDVEAVVPPSSAIDCIARLGGLRAQPVFGEVGPAGGGRRIRNVDPSQKMRRSFRGKMRPKEIDRSGLEPPHHLSGTEGSNPARSSGESANHLSGDRHTMPAPAAASCSSFRSSQRSTSAGANGRDGGFAPIGDRFADHARLGIMLRENRCALLSAASIVCLSAASSFPC